MIDWTRPVGAVALNPPGFLSFGRILVFICALLGCRSVSCSSKSSEPDSPNVQDVQASSSSRKNAESANSKNSNEATGPITMAKQTFKKEGAEYPLPYYLFAPAQYNPTKLYPLVIYLHGFGEKLAASPILTELTSASAQQEEPFFVLAPECPQNDEWINRHAKPPFANYDQSKHPESTASKLTFELIESLQKSHSIDSKRISITGYSMGGSGTWDFITRHPGIFSAAVPITGVNDPSRASVIRSLPIWVFHGELDQISPISNSRTMVSQLEALGAPVRFNQLKGVGHDSFKYVYSDKEVIRWLLAQRRE